MSQFGTIVAVGRMSVAAFALFALGGCSSGAGGPTPSSASAIGCAGAGAPTTTFTTYNEPNGFFTVDVPSTWSHGYDSSAKADRWNPTDFPYPEVTVSTRCNDSDALADDYAFVTSSPQATILSSDPPQSAIDATSTQYTVKFTYGAVFDYHKVYLVNGQRVALDILFDTSVSNSGNSEPGTLQQIADRISPSVLDSFQGGSGAGNCAGRASQPDITAP